MSGMDMRGGAERRAAVLALLEEQGGASALSASHLAAEFGVSRQVIVGDIALLRSSGHEIDATPRGYVMRGAAQVRQGGVFCALVCCHAASEMTDELNIMVDCGCTVLDVSVEHPVYGTLSGALALSSRYDVALFAEKVASSDALPLSVLTEGVHVHHILAPGEAQAEAVRAALAEKGYLV